ncbi:MAG: thermonuclease family protein [Pseudomonadota bacterium]
MIRTWIGCICFSLFACAPQTPMPDMQPGEIGRVTKVIDGDGLILDTGQRVRLISISAPVLAPPDGLPDPHSGESARLLEDMALGRQVQLFYPGMTRDRYDRALAHVVTNDLAGPRLWLNQEMVARGGARVRLYGSTSARGRELLDVEARARHQAIGLWALAAYAPQQAQDLTQDQHGYVIVFATLDAVVPHEENARFAPACRRAVAGASLLLDIDRDAASACGIANGTRVEIRGWLTDGVIRLRHPLHLTIESTP